MLEHDFIPVRLFLVCAVLLSSCAGFEPGLRLQDLHRPRQPTARATQGGLEVSVEEFLTQAKSRMVFDTDLAASGVAALLLRVENTTQERFLARKDDVNAWLGDQPLTALTPIEAANQAATSEYVGKALGWTIAAGPFAILLWPVTIGASAAHTHGVNRRIQQFFVAGGFQDALIGPKQTALGFRYFKIPEGTKATEKFRVEAQVGRKSDDEKLFYEFDLPVVKLSE